MKILKQYIGVLLLVCSTYMLNAQSQTNTWPVLKTYDQDHIQKTKMPVGGIGTGTISLTGKGSLEDWEIMNRPAKGEKITRILLDSWRMEGSQYNTMYVEYYSPYPKMVFWYLEALKASAEMANYLGKL